MKEKTTIRLDPELKRVAMEYAESQNRTLANFIEHLLSAELKRRGIQG